MNFKDLFRQFFIEELNELESCKQEIQELKRINEELENNKQIVEIEKPIVLRHFKTYHEMRQWFFNNPISEREYQKKLFNCVDFANTVQRMAFDDGLIVNVELELNGEYTKSTQKHMVCNCLIPSENMVYVIEPQTDAIIFSNKIKD